jgi:hypothetical protein
MHRHDRRLRQCQLPGAPSVVEVARHRCAHPECGAQWQTLPGFVARHLHFNWSPIEQACEGEPDRGRGGRVPSFATVRRWLSRLDSSASRLVRLLSDGARAVARRVSTRRELVDALGVGLAMVAALVHERMPGVRLM